MRGLSLDRGAHGIGAIVLAAIACACSASSRPEPRVARAEVGERTPREQRARPVPQDLQALRAAVAAVSRAADEPDRAKIALALGRLSDVVRADDRDAATRIDKLATQLEESSPRSGAHIDVIKRALREAALALAEPLPPRPPAGARNAYVAARRAEAELVADEPLRGQIAEVAAALRSVANLAAARHGLSPLFVTSVDAGELAHDPVRFAERARRASALVGELAADSDWKTSGTRAAAALDALADALAVAPVVAEPTTWGALVAAIRYEALELEREGGLSPGRSDRVKAGLAAAVRGLELATVQGDAAGSAVLEAARSAVEAIDASSAFVFQRAILQEAFRAAADAYLTLQRSGKHRVKARSGRRGAPLRYAVTSRTRSRRARRSRPCRAPCRP